MFTSFYLILSPLSRARLTPPSSSLLKTHNTLGQFAIQNLFFVIKGAIYFTLIEQIGCWVVSNDLSPLDEPYNAQVYV